MADLFHSANQTDVSKKFSVVPDGTIAGVLMLLAENWPEQRERAGLNAVRYTCS